MTSENGASISVVDTATHTVIQTIRLTGENVRPMGAVVSPDGQRLYVTTGRGGTVVALDTATNKPVGSVAVGTRPWGLALSPDGARLYTANGPSNDVSVDAATLSLVTKIPVGQSPWGVAVVERESSAVSTLGVITQRRNEICYWCPGVKSPNTGNKISFSSRSHGPSDVTCGT